VNFLTLFITLNGFLTGLLEQTKFFSCGNQFAVFLKSALKIVQAFIAETIHLD